MGDAGSQKAQHGRQLYKTVTVALGRRLVRTGKRALVWSLEDQDPTLNGEDGRGNI